MESFKKSNNITRNSVPRGFVEKWSKPIKAWASYGVHAPVGKVNLRMFKGCIQVIERQRSLRVKIIKVETPSSSPCSPKKVIIERMKKNFLIMIV